MSTNSKSVVVLDYRDSIHGIAQEDWLDGAVLNVPRIKGSTNGAHDLWIVLKLTSCVLVLRSYLDGVLRLAGIQVVRTRLPAEP